MGKLERICISIPSDLLGEFDEAIREVGYPNRSKAVQDAMRSFLAELKASKMMRGPVRGVIVMIYAHRKPGLVQEILEVQHEHEELVRATMHIHLSEEECLEVIATSGDASEIRELAETLRVKKGIKALKVVVL